MEEVLELDKLENKEGWGWLGSQEGPWMEGQEQEPWPEAPHAQELDCD